MSTGESEHEATLFLHRYKHLTAKQQRGICEFIGARRVDEASLSSRFRAMSAHKRMALIQLVLPDHEFSGGDDFDWDAFFAWATHAQVRDLAPVGGGRHPSCYSPDRTQLYLSSQDDVVENLKSEDKLRIYLRAVAASFHNEPPTNFERKACQYQDFLALCGLLANVCEDPDEFGDPDLLLASAVK